MGDLKIYFCRSFFDCVSRSLDKINTADVAGIATHLAKLKANGGRLFIIGNGGGAAHASHAAADFRRLAGIDAYCLSDNAASLTALANDDGWENCYSSQLDTMNSKDALLVVSVGGGSLSTPISANVVNAVDLAASKGVVLGIVGRDGGYTKPNSVACVVIPCDRPEWVTPVVEGVQSVVLHMIVTHPLLQSRKPKWESVDAPAKAAGT